MFNICVGILSVWGAKCNILSLLNHLLTLYLKAPYYAKFSFEMFSNNNVSLACLELPANETIL